MTQLNGNIFSAERRLERIVAMSLEMAEDEGLWFQAQTAAEAYLQQELRKLMHCIEDTP